MVPAVPLMLQRFHYGKSTSASSHAVAHQQEKAFCESKGGRLPTRLELCPSYSASSTLISLRRVPAAGNLASLTSFCGCRIAQLNLVSHGRR